MHVTLYNFTLTLAGDPRKEDGLEVTVKFRTQTDQGKRDVHRGEELRESISSALLTLARAALTDFQGQLNAVHGSPVIPLFTRTLTPEQVPRPEESPATLFTRRP